MHCIVTANLFHVGEWLSLVEHLVRDQGVGGSNPLSPTISEAHDLRRGLRGGAQVLFHKEPSEVEVLNDLDGEIVNFFRVCQQHHEELIRYFRFAVVSRRWFELQKATDPATLTDIQRAARYLYLLKNSFASLVRQAKLSLHVVQPPGFNLEKLPEIIEETHKRLARVQIECLPYEKFSSDLIVRRRSSTSIRRTSAGNSTATTSTTPTSSVLAERLAKLRGKFMLSLNDVPEVRKLFHRFNIQEVDLHYTAQKVSGRRYREVLITNF